MQNQETEQTLARFLGLGSFLVTILVVTGSVTDPVNVTKLVALGAVGIAVFFVVTFKKYVEIGLSARWPITIFICFLLASISALFASSAPLQQSLYGSYGRNNGFLAYFFLLCVLLGAYSLRSVTSFRLINLALYSSLIVNLVYCLWVIIFGDFLNWTNPYGNILGTFGNPNFSGAFIALGSVSLATVFFDESRSNRTRYLVLPAIAVGIFEVVKSNALQGQVLLVVGFGYLGFLLLYYKNKVISYIYLFMGLIFSIVGILGTQQIGPLASFLYKTSVTLRGQYWLAAWNMGNSNPWTGVGFDSYGDWYRRSREAKALTSPGVDVTSNTAHNVPLDIFAFGGWPLFASYLAILIMTVFSILRILRRGKSFNPLFASLSVAWFCYQLQSIISINQLGLAIWGWLLSGALIAFDKMDEKNKVNEDRPKTNHRRVSSSSGVVSAGIVGAIGFVVGAFMAWPALNADMKWSTAQVSRDLVKFEESLKPSFSNPQNSYKYGNSVRVLEQSGLTEKARLYALAAVEFNPDSYEAWKTLFLISGSTDLERKLAVQNMKRLDPLNPDVTAR